MTATDPQQDLFTGIKLALEARGYDVYDGPLPPASTPYPFIYLGDFRQSDSWLKNAVLGRVYPTIHVWHNNPRQRGTVSQMMLDIKTALYQLDRIPGSRWIVQSIDSRVFPDTTTNEPLLHGVVEATVLFS